MLDSEQPGTGASRPVQLTRRTLLVRLSTVAVGGLLAACSPGAPASPKLAEPKPTEPAKPAAKPTEAAKPAEAAKPTAAPAAAAKQAAPAAAGPVALTVHIPTNSMAGSSNAPLDEVLAEYQQKNPNVKVTVNATAVAQQRDKMATQALAGQLEDVVYSVVQWTTEFAANGWIADLTARLGGLDRADWPDASWTSSSFKGKVYGIPSRRDNFAFFYNKEQFQSAGITKFPETTDELLDAAKRLTRDGVYGISLVGADHPQTTTQFLSFMLMFGNTMFSTDFNRSVMNEPTAAQAARFYGDLVTAHKVAQPSAATDNRGEAEKLWMAGKGAMQLNGPWMLPVIKQQAPNLAYEVGLVPSQPGKPRLALQSGWDWAIAETTKSPDQAWELVTFLSEPRIQAKLTNTFPARLSAFKEPQFQDPVLQPWVESAKISYPNPATPAFPQTGLVIQRIVPQVIGGTLTPEAAMTEAHREAETLLKQFA